jgi:hypothetical protein
MRTEASRTIVPQIAELARKTCEPLAQQSEFLQKE